MMRKSKRFFFISFIIMILVFQPYSFQSVESTSTDETIKPLKRFGHRMVYLPDEFRIMMFGGDDTYPSVVKLRSLWSYNVYTGEWTDHDAINAPPPRMSHGFVYIPSEKKIMVFGGVGTEEYLRLNDTWLYDTSTGLWSEISLITKPSSRSDMALYYDPVLDGVVLFGGSTETSLLDDTWVFFMINKTWVQMNPDTYPAGRYGAEMFYDTFNDKGILFGGRTSVTYTDETWAFNSNIMNWTQIFTLHKPIKRYWYNMAFVPEYNQTFIYGGRNDAYPNSALTHFTSYNITNPNWTDVQTDAYAVRPTARFLSSMVYIDGTGIIILYGGTAGFTNVALDDDLWGFSLIYEKWFQLMYSPTITDPYARLKIWIISFSSLVGVVIIVTLSIILIRKRSAN